MSACLATIFSVFCSPLPPIMTGILRVGGGFSFAQRSSMRGSAAASAFRRVPGVPNS